MSVSSSSSGAEKKSDSNWFGLDVKLAEVFEKEVRSPVRQQVSETREDISRWWSNSGFASFSKAVSDLPSRPPQLLQEGKERVLQRSQEMHNNYPYLASLCRSHETLLLGTTALLVGIPAKRLPAKYFMFSLALSLVTAKGAIMVVNSKYELAGKEPTQS